MAVIEALSTNALETIPQIVVLQSVNECRLLIVTTTDLDLL
jgi:hypothetical protein